MNKPLSLPCDIVPAITLFDGSRPVKRVSLSGLGGSNELLTVDNTIWEVNCVAVEKQAGVFDLRAEFRLASGQAASANASVMLRFSNWSAANYVLLPAAAYNGNRFGVRKMPYAPMLADPADLKPDVPTLITDIPRLNLGEGVSKIQLMTRDLSTPAAGFYDPANRKAFWMITDQGTEWGDSAVEVEESENRLHVDITVSAPGVRHLTRYTICDTETPSEDSGAQLDEGDTIHIRARLYYFDCLEVQGLFDRFMDIRQDLSGEVPACPVVPFSHAWGIQESKYNKQNWFEQLGYYSVGMRENMHQDWQIGWVGGLMATYPLLFEGDEISRGRALRNIDFVFNGGQDKSGFFHGFGHQGQWYGDHFSDPYLRWHLIRKSADALYYLVKHFMLLRKQQPDLRLPEQWLAGTRACADAFVSLWNRYGQFGQFVNSETGEIIVGGSASAAIAPAGLALASRFFGEPAYMKAAEESAEYLYRNFTVKGYTTGGPGEILQCPDSESAFGLLESFIVLYEVTGGRHWIDKATAQANQCATWCVSYDFDFPQDSTFGKLGMKTAGTVYANVQNKHSAPGICTLSGDSLFKLFRATGNRTFMDLIRQIAHSLPQYLSRDDRPIDGLRRFPGGGPEETELVPMPAGWMNERVEMSDWWEPVGEIFYGSCWCEVSAMMTYVEVPGLYVQPDTGLVYAIDHVTVGDILPTADGLEVTLHNPTPFEANIKVLSEPSGMMGVPLGQNALWGCRTIRLEPGETGAFHF